MRTFVLIGAIGCTAAPEEGGPVGSGSETDIYAYNETRYASSIDVEVDGVQASFGEGEFFLTRVVDDGATCASSGLLRVRTLAGDLSAEFYFDSDTLEGDATLPVAPFDHDSVPIWIRELNGVEFVVLSGGTATYEQVGTDHEVAIAGASLCAAPDNSSHEVDAATCDPITFSLALVGTLGTAPDVEGAPGWSSTGGTAVCIASN